MESTKFSALRLSAKVYYHISSVKDRVFPFQNNPKHLDLSYKTDLDLWDCFGRKKLVLQQNFKFRRTDLIIYSLSREGNTVFYSRINTVFFFFYRA